MENKINNLNSRSHNMQNINKINYYLDIAQDVMKHSTCKYRQCGAIIVSHDQIVSTGYHHIIRKSEEHRELGKNIYQNCRATKGECYEYCLVAHAEAMAINNATDRLTGATLYLVGKDMQSGNLISDIKPCEICLYHIIKAGIVRVVSRISPTDYNVVSVGVDYA